MRPSSSTSARAPLGVLFSDRPDAEQRFADERRESMVERLRLMCRIALLLVPLFFALDLLLHPAVVAELLAIRAIMVLCCVVALALLRAEAGRRHVAAVSFFMVWQAGFGVALMTGLDAGGSSGYYAGINLVMLGAAVLLPWTPAFSAAAAGALIGSYVLVCAAWGGIPDVATFVQNLFFLGSTALIMVVSHRTLHRAHQHDFLQRLELEQSSKHRDAFLANITHELRTPLVSILGYTEMLVDYMPGATAEQRGWLARIHENSVALYRLIVQLLDFSKMEAGALELARDPLGLPAIVDKVAGDMRALAGDVASLVEVTLPTDAPRVIGDGARVEEIVTNLAANAVKFSGGRPIRLALRTTSIHATPWQRVVPDPGPDARGREYAEIAVTDTGVGIRPEDLRRLFQAFFQLDGSSTRRHEGTGLGLAISARLAASMGGHIAVRTAPGEGSTFALLLPIEPTLDVGPLVDEAEPLASLSA